MLEQIIRWMDIVGTGFDALLLLRILSLRLYRVYTFITLYCAITLLLDVAAWLAGWESPASDRILIYSRFLMAVVFPLAAWDCFEQIRQQVAKYRTLQLGRMLSGLVVMAIFGLLLSVSTEDQVVSGMSATTVGLGVLFWAASASSSALFLWNMRRAATRGGLSFTSNTWVLWVFFLLTFLCELTECLLEIMRSLMNETIAVSLGLLVSSFSMGVILWCVIKLRGVAPDATAQQSAGA